MDARRNLGVGVRNFSGALGPGGARCPGRPPEDGVADDLYYEPEQLEIRDGEPTIVHLTNEGGIVHDLSSTGGRAATWRPVRRSR
jgi:hypothetical protein